MRRAGTIATTWDYGKKLANAGVTGVRTSKEFAEHGQASAKVLRDSAVNSLALATIGASVGFAMGRGRRGFRTLGLGIIGFCAGLAWGTRKLMSNVAQSAYREMQRASDEHWLELHPIDYA